MANSYRIRTNLGENQNIQVNLEQDFDFLEILSLKIFQSDIYTRDCSDYGVVCGRVFSNKGTGLPNARVSIFIPVTDEDLDNPIISTIYPYKEFTEANEDGYKYNLLPYSKSYSNHTPVGTFPDRLDVLTNNTVVEVYEKYYKYTCKTNEAGDYMIFGVPTGNQSIFMQIDLSDMGEFSLTPPDLIRMGIATEEELDGTKFQFSENYTVLPQIVTLSKNIEVAPFFGQEEVCDFNVGRVDFDLTSEANVKIQPTAVFMGSIFSTNEKQSIKRKCKVKSKTGELCQLITGPGQIEAIRHSFYEDENQRPVLEVFRIENNGKIIDDNGTWLTEVPMNLNYVYTDENGERQISDDPTVGIPTKGRYRFKIKWQQQPDPGLEYKRGYFLVPNIREYGWDPDALSKNNGEANDPAIPDNFPNEFEPTLFFSSGQNTFYINTVMGFDDQVWEIKDFFNVKSVKVFINGEERPSYTNVIPTYKFENDIVQVQIEKDDETQDANLTYITYSPRRYLVEQSYAFSLNWDEYANPEAAINCEDTFYEFDFNKVFTVSQFIDRYNKYRGSLFPARPRSSLQIKQITDTECEGSYNTFPVNDTKYKNKFLVNFFIYLISQLTFVTYPLLAALHLISLVLGFIIAIVNLIIAILNPILDVIVGILNAILGLIELVIDGLCWILNSIASIGFSYNKVKVGIYFYPFTQLVPGFCNEDDIIPSINPIELPTLENPLKNFGLPLLLNTEDGCERCKCKNKEDDDVEDIPLSEGNDTETDGNLAQLLDSLSNCATAVNFKSNPNQPNPNPLLDGEWCYNTDAQGNVTIDTVQTIQTNDGTIQAPLCTTALSDISNVLPNFLLSLFGLDEPFKIFQYGRGCYNLLGVPLASLPRDFASLSEWSNRVKVNIAICNEVFDHTFSNAWVNGTLFMPTLQNKLTYDSQNEPVRKFCKEIFYFHEPTNNLYHRSAPFSNSNEEVFNTLNLSNGNFCGRVVDAETLIGQNVNGNEYNLMNPTTIINLGPKVGWLQEITLSNTFDGYIIDKIESTTYGDNTELLNLLVLSRLTNLSSWEQILGIIGGNAQNLTAMFGIPPGAMNSDPIVNLFFKNLRWGNGSNFLGLPGLIDGDYAQAIAINSEFGVEKFSTEDSGGNSVYFVMDQLNPPKPVLGVNFESNQQYRDFLTPRRKIWNFNGAINGNSIYDYESFETSTQEVPFYRWRIDWTNSDWNAGTQNNDMKTQRMGYSGQNFPKQGYQDLDRLDINNSKYPVPDAQLGTANFYKGFIANFEADGNFKNYKPVGVNDDHRTVGMPFYFYFGLIKGSSAWDRFMTKYVNTDTNEIS